MKKNKGFGTEEERKKRLVSMIQSEPDAEDCQTCLSKIDDYIDAQLTGRDYLAEFADVAVHLDACLDCAAVYAQLYELEAAAATDQIPQPARYPDPQLDFLLQGRKPTVTPMMELLQKGVHQTAEKISLLLSTDLLNRLQLSATPSPQTRASAKPRKYQEVLFQLSVKKIPHLQIPFTVTAYRDLHRQQYCLLEIVVEPPDRSWPELDGYRIKILAADEPLEAVTDVWGTVSFSDVAIEALSQLQIEVFLE